MAHGGKDRHPFPVPITVYDQTIRVLKSAVAKARLGREEELAALKRLDDQARRLEGRATGPAFPRVLEQGWRGFAREWRTQRLRLGAPAQAHQTGLTTVDQPPCALWTTRQIRSGVAAISICAMPSGASASRIALIIVCGAAMQPAWAAPLTPSS
jgi:hypothetical protein